MKRVLYFLSLFLITTLLFFGALSSFVYSRYEVPSGCELISSGYCPRDKPFNCHRTLFCCPDETFCPKITPTPVQCDICKCDPTTNPPSKSEQCSDCSEECRNCLSDDGSWTALGCIPQDPTSLVAWILKWAMGIGGGVAFILIIIGAFQVITSSGDPDKVKTGKDIITAAVSGLLFIIFSLFLLQFIGVKILNIPGFGK